MLISVPTPCSSRASQFTAHVTLVVFFFWKKLRHDILSTGLKENAVHPSTVHIPRRRRTLIHACDSCRRHVVGHETRLRGSSTTTSRPLHDKDGGIRYVSILRTTSDTTL